MTRDDSLIAYCGLYCEDCHGFNGRIPDLARDLIKELREARYDKFAEFISGYGFGEDFKNYEECYKVLGAARAPDFICYSPTFSMDDSEIYVIGQWYE